MLQWSSNDLCSDVCYSGIIKIGLEMEVGLVEIRGAVVMPVEAWLAVDQGPRCQHCSA